MRASPANARPLSNDFWLLSKTVTGTPAALAATSAIPRPLRSHQLPHAPYYTIQNDAYHLSGTNDTQLLDLGSLCFSQPLAARAKLAAYWADRVPGKASCEGS